MKSKVKTLRQVLERRTIDCCVDTDVADYNGLAKDLLKAIPERELRLNVIHMYKDYAGGYFWVIQTTRSEKDSVTERI
ncbi:MAG: hypothetical protein ACLRPU_00070 [Enterococcus hulanensis]